ncbi:MAG: hypothetical protein WKF65_08655 [Gaiellaceae bacterium]
MVAAVGWILVGAILGRAGTDMYEFMYERVFADPPPLAEQLSEIVSRAARDDFRLIEQRSVNLRGVGAPARIMIFRPTEPFGGISDELRVYDTRDGRFRERLTFRPAVPLELAPESLNPTIFQGRPLENWFERRSHGRSFVFRFKTVDDLNGTRGDEVILDIAEVAMQPIWPRPVYLSWNPSTEQYQLRSLLSPLTTNLRSMRPMLTRSYSRPGDFARFLIEESYRYADPIRDATGHSPPLQPFAVEAYVVEPSQSYDPRGTQGGAIVLHTGYFVRGRAHASVDLLQLLTWRVNLSEPVIRAQHGWSNRLVLIELKWSGHTLDQIVRRSASRAEEAMRTLLPGQGPIRLQG